MFGHLVSWLINQDREKDEERHEQVAQLVRSLALHENDSASTEFREWALPVVKQWVVQNLDPHATASFVDSSIAVRHLDDEAIGIAGAVDVTVGTRSPVRNWFIAEIAESGTIVLADFVDFDPRAPQHSGSAT